MFARISSERKVRNDEATLIFYARRGASKPLAALPPRTSSSLATEEGSLSDSPVEAEKQEEMENRRPDSSPQQPSQAHIKESARRLARHSMRRDGWEGETIQHEQKRIDRIGTALRATRLRQERPLIEVAKAAQIQPEMFCFLESGLVTIEELLTVIDQWASALGLDSAEYIKRLSPASNGKLPDPDMKEG